MAGSTQGHRALPPADATQVCALVVSPRASATPPSADAAAADAAREAERMRRLEVESELAEARADSSRVTTQLEAAQAAADALRGVISERAAADASFSNFISTRNLDLRMRKTPAAPVNSSPTSIQNEPAPHDAPFTSPSKPPPPPAVRSRFAKAKVDPPATAANPVPLSPAAGSDVLGAAFSTSFDSFAPSQSDLNSFGSFDAFSGGALRPSEEASKAADASIDVFGFANGVVPPVASPLEGGGSAATAGGALSDPFAAADYSFAPAAAGDPFATAPSFQDPFAGGGGAFASGEDPFSSERGDFPEGGSQQASRGDIFTSGGDSAMLGSGPMLESAVDPFSSAGDPFTASSGHDTFDSRDGGFEPPPAAKDPFASEGGSFALLPSTQDPFESSRDPFAATSSHGFSRGWHSDPAGSDVFDSAPLDLGGEGVPAADDPFESARDPFASEADLFPSGGDPFSPVSALDPFPLNTSAPPAHDSFLSDDLTSASRDPFEAAADAQHPFSSMADVFASPSGQDFFPGSGSVPGNQSDPFGWGSEAAQEEQTTSAFGGISSNEAKPSASGLDPFASAGTADSWF